VGERGRGGSRITWVLARPYQSYLRHPFGGWYDQFDRHGRSLVDFVPASSFIMFSVPSVERIGFSARSVTGFAMQHRSLQRNGTGKNIGTAKTFNQLKRYGFIRSDVDGKDVFVHLSAVRQAGLTAVRKGQSYLLKSTTVVARRLYRICG
jgi:cold shock CspA family protein